MAREAGAGRKLPLDAFTKDAAIDLFEMAFPFVLLMGLLLNLMIGPLSVLTVAGCVGLFCVVRWQALPAVLKASWALILLPLVALASVMWSLQPEATLRYGTLFLISTIAAVMMGAGIKPASLLKGTFAALFLFSIMCLLGGRWVGWGGAGQGGIAFAGLLGSKNAMGEVAGMALLSSIAISQWSLPRRAFAWLLCGLAAIPLSLYLLWASKATGALIAAVIASFCLVLWNISRRLPVQARVAVFFLAILAMALAAIFQDVWLPPLFDAVLESSGKDAGLTGRADLWRKADSLIAERPWFGMGYSAFWVHHNLDAEYLWRLMGINGRAGFNFHNTQREILVALGYVGLAIYALVAGIYSLILITRTMLTAKTEYVFASAMLVYFAFKIPFESFGFGGMSVTALMVYAILAMGAARPPGSKSRSA
ncbi:exopolysaccharide production protein ExoQ [Altererythrobacter atlanticus]|uniref:O-antigen ligase family protein n=1 Tax=Croceibacterium atlanticum TaxID=1267766 RepID=UPI001605F729|nr:O-antigen ligase family protein [Croceibacterium atlanticum]MBB5731574.1 exopolysaccharide production protein ExoQ [Croceibacterium atlanticum]